MTSTPLTLFLYRDGYSISKSRLRAPQDYREVGLIDPGGDNVAWQFYFKQTPTQPVRWLPRVQAIMQNPTVVTMSAQSAGAVLLVSAHGRLWAATFGTGHHAINRSEYEPDFGLKVAANSVDPRRVTLAETRGLDKGARNSVSILPQPNEIYALRVSTNEEWVRRFGGKTLDPSLGLSVAGADSLRLNLNNFNLRDLPAKLQRLLTVYESDAYKISFPFLDYFRQIPRADPIITELNDRLDQVMLSRSTDIGFASPDDLEHLHPDEYTLKSGRREIGLAELTPDSVYGAIDELEAWSNPRESILVTPERDEQASDERRLLGQYVVANIAIDEGDSRTEYTLTANAWFRIDQSYAERIARYVDAVPDATGQIDLTQWDSNWLKQNIIGPYDEFRFNKHASAEHGYALLDRQFYRDDSGAGQQVEVCDLLTPDRKLICVKKLDGAESMVQLFEQGALSAGMMRDDAYQRRLLADLATTGGSTESFGQPSDWTFVFAIATSREGNLKDLLSFFGKVALHNNAEAIRGRGFNVTLVKIPRIPPAAVES